MACPSLEPSSRAKWKTNLARSSYLFKVPSEGEKEASVDSAPCCSPFVAES